MHKLHHRLSDQSSRAGRADNCGAGRIGKDDGTLAVDNHAIRYGFHQPVVPFFALAQCLVRLFARSDVKNEALPERRLAFQIGHKHVLVMHPNSVPIPGNHSIFHIEWFVVLICLGGLGDDTLAVLRMQRFRP